MIQKSLTILSIAAVFISGTSHASKPNPQAYPENFLWGVAFSAHQAEGKEGGGEFGDWYKFEHSTNRSGEPNIENGDTADIAVDHWNRFDEDFTIADKLGVNTVRISIAWEKIEPRPGVYNRIALEHYRLVLQNMIAKGIRPMVALHHFTHPQWFHEIGGWTNPASAGLFARYTEKVVSHLKDLCDLWITFNEPMIVVQMGYLMGQIPPQLKSIDSAFEAAYNLARAHRASAAMIHQIQGYSPNARGAKGELRGVGVVNSLQVYDPMRPRLKRDREAAEAIAEMTNWAYLRAVRDGKLRFRIPGYALRKDKIYERDLPKNEFEGHIGPYMDWIGVNFYTHYLVKFNLVSPVRAFWKEAPGVKGDNGWTIYPEGIERILRQTHRHFPKYPLVLSENGLADGDDSRRPKYIVDHLKSLDGAVLGSAQGPALDVRGYYHWSLFDNFEWLHGFRYRFGLVEIDYANDLKRMPRQSADVYRREILARSPKKGAQAK